MKQKLAKQSLARLFRISILCFFQQVTSRAIPSALTKLNPFRNPKDNIAQVALHTKYLVTGNRYRMDLHLLKGIFVSSTQLTMVFPMRSSFAAHPV